MSKVSLLRRPAMSDLSISIADATLEDIPLIYVSAGFERLCGYQAEEIIGRNCRFLQRAERDQEGLEVLRRALENDEACSTILLNYTTEGRPFWNQLNMAPVFDEAGRATHIIGIQNAVGQARAEQYLREHVGSSGEADQLAGFQRLVNVASEGFREPLEELDAARKRLAKADPEESEKQRAFRLRSLEGMVHAERMIEGLMVLSRLSGASPTLRACEFSKVMENVSKQFGPLLERYKIHTEFEAAAPVSADPSRVETMFRLLMRDSLSVPRERHPSRIALRNRSENGATVRVTYEDDRAGVDHDEIEEIREMLSRLEQPNASYPAHLDLAACKTVTLQHKGKFHVRPGDEGGIAFDIEFKAARSG